MQTATSPFVDQEDRTVVEAAQQGDRGALVGVAKALDSLHDRVAVLDGDLDGIGVDLAVLFQSNRSGEFCAEVDGDEDCNAITSGEVEDLLQLGAIARVLL